MEQQLTREPPELPEELPLMAYAERPDSLSAVCDSFNHIHLSWQDERGRRREIFYMGRVGRAWSLDIPLTSDDGSDSVSPAIGINRNNKLQAVWSDHLHAELATENTEIYYQVGTIPIVTVSKPEVTYNAEIETIDIFGIVATSSSPTIDTLDPSENQVNYYQIYDSFNVPTDLSGNMTWTANGWEATDVDVSSLSQREYYVRCFFSDVQTMGVSRPSDLFRISPAPPLTTSTLSPFVEEFPLICVLNAVFETLLICCIKIWRNRARRSL